MKFREFFKDTSPFGQLVYFLLMLGFGLALATMFLIVFATQSIEGEALVRTKLYSQGASQLLMFMVPALLFAWLFHGNAKTYFKMSFSRKNLTATLLGCLAMVVAIPLADSLTTWNEGIHLPESMQAFEASSREMAEKSKGLTNSFLALQGIPMLMCNLLILGIIPAFCEELVFRGVLQQLFMKWFGRPHLSIILVAAIFSLTHFELFSFMPRFALGIMLGYIYYYGGTIWASFFAHFLNNGLIVVLSYIHLQNGLVGDPQNLELPCPILFATISLLLSALTLYIIAKKSKKTAENAAK